MKLTMREDCDARRRIYTLEILHEEIDLLIVEGLELSKFEQIALEVADQEGTPVSHKLIGLEIIARKIEQAHEAISKTPRNG